MTYLFTPHEDGTVTIEGAAGSVPVNVHLSAHEVETGVYVLAKACGQAVGPPADELRHALRLVSEAAEKHGWL